MRLKILFATLAFAAVLHGQAAATSGFSSALFASAPSPLFKGQVFMFTDAIAAGVCTGGGTATAACWYNGSAWVALGIGIAASASATASTVALRDGSGNLIATNTVAEGKMPMATDTSVVIAQIADALITSAKMHASTFDVQATSGTITWTIGSVLNAQASITFSVHNTTAVLNITNPVIGGNYVLKLIQDGTGGELITLGSGCTWKVANGGAGAITLTNAPNALDVLAFVYDGANCLASFLPNLN